MDAIIKCSAGIDVHSKVMVVTVTQIASFIPPRNFRDLRMITRYRTKLSGVLAGEKNRLIKVLDSCGIKLANVVSNINGVSATRIIEALIDGQQLTPEDIARMLAGNLRKKHADVILAVDGRISDHTRYLLKKIRDHIGDLEKKIKEIDVQVVMALEPYKQEWQLLQTIPGFDEISAAMLLVEIGVDMNQFKTKERLSAWAGLAPGNNESAGKKSPHAYERATRTSNA